MAPGTPSVVDVEVLGVARALVLVEEEPFEELPHAARPGAASRRISAAVAGLLLLLWM